MAEGTEGAQNFDISNVISRAFGTIGANVPAFIGLSLILSGIPAFALAWWQEGMSQPGAIDPASVNYAAVFLPVLVWVLVTMITNAILQAALTRATVLHLSGETPSFGRCLAVGFAMILPMIGIGFITSLGIGIGLLLLIVPGIILAMAWSVAVPVYVQEKAGVFGSLSRSGELTKGARWKIFLVLLIIGIGVWILNLCGGLLAVAVGAALGSIGVAAVNAVAASLGAMINVALIASIYVELRDVKEGVAPSELESIFA